MTTTPDEQRDDGRRPGMNYSIQHYMTSPDGIEMCITLTSPVPFPPVRDDVEADAIIGKLPAAPELLKLGPWRFMTAAEIEDYRNRPADEDEQ
jgi:hypothetical protein